MVCGGTTNAPQLVGVTCLITEQLNCSNTQFVCAWMSQAHTEFVRNIKRAIITVIINY